MVRATMLQGFVFYNDYHQCESLFVLPYPVTDRHNNNFVYVVVLLYTEQLYNTFIHKVYDLSVTWIHKPDRGELSTHH